MPLIPPLPDHTTPTHRSIGKIATEILADWTDTKSGVHYSARPYLQAMRYLHNRDSTYGVEDARGIVLGFLSNASQYRTAKAAGFKKELKAIFGIK